MELIRQNQYKPRDSGKGGFGLPYIAERIQLAYGEPYGIRIDSREGKFTAVTICLPNQAD